MVFSLNLKAAYLAGNITYKWINGYTYQIKYTTYTTAYTLSDPYCEIDSICFGDGTYGIAYRNNGPCNGPCSPLGCEGVILAGGLNIKMNEYTITHTYSGPGNYKVCFEKPNRTAGVINIANSVNQIMAFESLLVIPTFGSGKNTSSVFANHPLESGCFNNGCFTHNPLATDLEGDSLSYEIIMCMLSGGTTASGYTYPSTAAGGTFSINAVTGLLNWCTPQLAGEYSVGILIKEWRKDDGGTYFLVGYVVRDTYLSVSTCTGINDVFEKENQISVFPNPVTENLTIIFNQSIGDLFNINLLDITGRTIKTLITKEPSIQLQTENINPGIYFLKIIRNNTTITKKIIKH